MFAECAGDSNKLIKPLLVKCGNEYLSLFHRYSFLFVTCQRLAYLRSVCSGFLCNNERSECTKRSVDRCVKWSNLLCVLLLTLGYCLFNNWSNC